MNTVQTQYFQGFVPPDTLELECGQRVGPVRIAYETYGTLNIDRSNAILVCHALSGDAHAAGLHADDPQYVGWWDNLIGPQKPLDTDRYYIICSNVLGGCKGSTGPSSVDPETGTPFGLGFPVITIGDMVRAQKELLDHLGITSVKLVIGGSMGGMQALQWAISYPTMVRGCMPIAATASLSTQALAFDAVGRNAITSDPHWGAGNYYEKTSPETGLAIARMIGHITYLSDESMTIKFGRKLQEKTDYGYDFTTDFQIESYLKYQGDKFVHRFDANSYLYLTKAISYFDLAKQYGSLENAFQNVRSRFLVVAIDSDWLYPAKQSKDITKALMRIEKSVSYAELHSSYGHDAFLIPNPELNRLVENFLYALD